MIYRDQPAPAGECVDCLAWYAEFQRAALLLERLADDVFADQAAFEKWCALQTRQAIRAAASGAPPDAASRATT